MLIIESFVTTDCKSLIFCIKLSNILRHIIDWRRQFVDITLLTSHCEVDDVSLFIYFLQNYIHYNAIIHLIHITYNEENSLSASLINNKLI